MSRAFVKEDGDRPERPVPRVVSEGPNYVTAGGFALLREGLAAARERGDERDATYFDRRIADAIVVSAHEGKRTAAAFGSTVTVRDGRSTVRVRIVGEDEADPVHGSISWSSPYARALLGRRAGDRVVVERPAGAATIVIEAVEPIA